MSVCRKAWRCQGCCEDWPALGPHLRLLHGPSQDLLDPALQAAIVAAVEARTVAGVGLETICASFSTAVTPPIRTSQLPEGIPNLAPSFLLKVQQGNAHRTFVVRLVRVLILMEIPFWLENPDTSWFWRQPSFVALQEDFPQVGFWRYDCCRFGKDWRKRTKVYTNTALAGQLTLCHGGHVHQVLRGGCQGHKMSWTTVAESYPASVCEWDTSRRIGEAKNPGPRRPLLQREGSLFDVELLEVQTIQVRVRIWDTVSRMGLHKSGEAEEPSESREGSACETE